MDSAPGQADYKSPMVNFLPFGHFLPPIPPAPQHFLKEINPEYSLGRLMLKLKLQYFGHLMPRVNSLEKTLMLGKTESRRRGQQRMR